MSSVFPSADSAIHVQHRCPRCSGRTFRTARRPIDRFFSGITPVQRFRCESFRCQWEGNVRVSRDALAHHPSDEETLDTSAPEPGPPWSFVVSTSMALAGLVAIVSLLFENSAV